MWTSELGWKTRDAFGFFTYFAQAKFRHALYTLFAHFIEVCD